MNDAADKDYHCAKLAPKTTRHRHRDLLRKLRKGTKWPGTYTALVRIWDSKRQITVRKKIAILLPSEALHALLTKNTADKLLSQAGLCPDTKKHMQSVFANIGPAAALSFWCDGMPCNWDRSMSLEVMSWGLPGVSAQFRMPILALQKRFVAKTETFHDICSVLLWDLESLCSGVRPLKRHDNVNWLTEDRVRHKNAGKDWRVKAVMAEFKGDWAMLASLFHLPNWVNKDGICWRCTATGRDIANCGMTAQWRSERLSHWAYMHRHLQKGKPVNPLLLAPFVTTDCVKLVSFMFKS